MPKETREDTSKEAEPPKPAPDTDIIVREGGNGTGDVFIRFGDTEENRRVELLNEADTQELYDKLGKTDVVSDQPEGASSEQEDTAVSNETFAALRKEICLLAGKDADSAHDMDDLSDQRLQNCYRMLNLIAEGCNVQ